MSSSLSLVAVTPDCNVQVNWKASTADGSSCCWDILHLTVMSRVPLNCSKSAVKRSGRSKPFLLDSRRSATNDANGFWLTYGLTVDDNENNLGS